MTYQFFRMRRVKWLTLVVLGILGSASSAQEYLLSPKNQLVFSIQDTTQSPTTETVNVAADSTRDAILQRTVCHSDCSCPQHAAAGKKKEDPTADVKNAYATVFYGNNFQYLQSPNYDGPYFAGDALKGLLNGKLDLGGEYRSRYQSEKNHRGLGITGLDDQFWLTRTRLFANYRANEYLRFYGEYLYADSAGEDFAPRAIEENRGEAQNLFVDVALLDTGNIQMTGRLGRQELILGNERLVSPLDWANTRRTFDGYRLTLSAESTDLDLFYTNPVLRVPETGGTNEWDSSNNDTRFYGAYLSNRATDLGTLETYYLGFENQPANFSFHTLGSRIVGAKDRLLYEFEGGVQFGDNSNGSTHNAGFLTAGLGRKLDLQLAGRTWSPTVWGWYDWASGADQPPFSPGDNGLNHLYPLAHKYLGFMDLFGRRNINDFNLQFITPLTERVSFLFWYHYLYLDEATTPYSVAMTPYNAGTAAVSKDLGNEYDLLFTVNVNPRNSMLLGYSYFDVGDYYDTPGVLANENAQFLYWQYQVRF